MDDQHVEPTGLAQVYAGGRLQLLRFLTARLRDPHEAEEILQDLAVRLMETRPGPVANPMAYLYRMALNLANDRIRQGQRRLRREAHFADPGELRPGGGTMDPQPSAERTLIAREEASRIIAAIDRMPPGAARVLRMHRLEGRSHAQIAKTLGISQSAVEKHMAVALRHLVRALRTEVGGGGGVNADD